MNFAGLFKISLPLLVVTMFCGCGTIRPHYLQKPEKITVNDPYVHAGSKIVLPLTIGDFQCTSLLRYDADGLDISGSYHVIDITPVVATIYVYPAPPLSSYGSPNDVVAEARARLAANEFARQKWAICQIHPGANLVEEHDVVQNENGHPYPGKYAVFSFEQKVGGVMTPVQSELYVFCYVRDKWAVAYRFTHPKSDHANQKVKEFMEKWHWFDAAP